VSLIRGNHEFFNPCVLHDDFHSELNALYGDAGFAGEISAMFEWMPVAANVMDYAFAVHGGISPALLSLSQLEELPRPLAAFEPKIVEDIMWSDPCEEFPDVMPSRRGLGVVYGINVVRRFFERTGFSVIVRGHQAIQSGVRTSLNYRVLTVFSASNYCQDADTQTGVVKIVEGPMWEKRILAPLGMIHRYDVAIVPSDTFTRKITPRRGIAGNRGVKAAATAPGLPESSVFGSGGMTRLRKAITMNQAVIQPIVTRAKMFP
jgi:diadenosine tetraphosphatase ApaH/serine/threonine PP2A family protein phosphatase